MSKTEVNRALLWIRKALQVTEKTTMPESIEDELRGVVDAFGWERLDQTTTRRTIAVNASTVTSPAVPADVLRLITEASVQTNDTVQAFTMWMEHIDLDAGLATGIMRPVAIPISAVTIRVGLHKMVVLRPGDQLSGRSSPAVGVALDLRLTERFVDLPIGEYVRMP